jgi:hypothetical protein
MLLIISLLYLLLSLSNGQREFRIILISKIIVFFVTAAVV